jgi:hypothetical protein
VESFKLGVMENKHKLQEVKALYRSSLHQEAEGEQLEFERRM